MTINYKKIILISVIFLLFAVPVSAAKLTLEEKRVLKSEKSMLKQNVVRYDGRIKEINKDLLTLKMNTEWLLLKILRIEDQERMVPLSIQKAKDSNEFKTETLEIEKKRLKGFIKEHKKNIITIEARLNGPKKKKAPAVKKSAKKKGTKKKTSATVLKKELQRKADAGGLKNWVKLKDGRYGVKLETTLPILFASGKTSIPKEYRKFFKNLSRLIKPYKVKVEVEGFTDRSRVKNKKYDSNFEIGAKRAASVVNQFIKEGVDPSVFVIKTSGQYGRGNSGSGKKSKALSRRAEIRIYFERT